ncbi:unnamed protein product [Spirodela intermedia]|uniref:Uncharacterized protein n=1 Tax=Spirodela intermedia TaxID=51605 RepID=A0A7I8L6C4_SPIIN|nr:unnamed protein product [Spirodela intermedia]
MSGRRRGRGGGEVMESIYSVLALVLVLVACVELCDAATVVDVYRLIQYDLAGIPFGSRAAGLNHHAGAPPFSPGTDLSRTVALMPLRELNLTFLQDYITSKNPLGGLLLLLPQKLSEKVGDDRVGKVDQVTRSALADLERLLIHANLPYAVYFAFEDEKIDAILADVRRSDNVGQPASATTGGYKLVVSSPEPKKIQSPTITNIQGWLSGLKGDGDVNQLPTIAIVASYDTFGAAPALSVGGDSNGSGAVVLLEIARLFSGLYSSPKTRGRYNILFGLTSGGPYNYNGTLKWLRSLDQRVRESIDYAICLNSIGSWNNELWMHISKPPENAVIKQIYESLADVAGELGVTIGIKHKKINISNPRVAWEHEQFSRLRLTAVTLSELAQAPELLESTGGLYDTRNAVDEMAVIRSAKIVAESLAKHIYGHQRKKIHVFEDNSSLAVNPAYISSWLDLFSKTPRVAPFLSKADPLISALKKELSDHTVEVSLQHDVLDGMFTFYDSSSAKLSIYQVASVTFDLLLLLAVGSYLVVLFSFLVIATRGLDDLLSIFRRPPPRKLKVA